ncbi:MAG: tRNA pseudouridine(38-40) synthase TruA, partial [Thermoplasmata archaeon]
MRIAVKFGYDGTLFHGYQRQKNAETVEGRILSFLVDKNLLSANPRFASASRTDAGVSALGNVVAFNTPENPEKILG